MKPLPIQVIFDDDEGLDRHAAAAIPTVAETLHVVLRWSLDCGLYGDVVVPADAVRESVPVRSILDSAA